MTDFKPYGEYAFTAYDSHDNFLWRQTKRNLLTQAFYTAVLKLLDYTNQTPDADSLNVNYMAIGDDNTAATIADTTLEHEIYRSTFLSKDITSSQLTGKIFLPIATGNPSGGIIKEVGVFVDGTATTDSGLLMSRAVVNINKNNNIKLIIQWKFRVQEA